MGKKNEGRGLHKLSNVALHIRLKILVNEHHRLNDRVDAMSRLQAMGNNQEYLLLKQKKVRKKNDIEVFKAEIKRRENITKRQVVADSIQNGESRPAVQETIYF